MACFRCWSLLDLKKYSNVLRKYNKSKYKTNYLKAKRDIKNSDLCN